VTGGWAGRWYAWDWLCPTEPPGLVAVSCPCVLFPHLAVNCRTFVLLPIPLQQAVTLASWRPMPCSKLLHVCLAARPFPVSCCTHALLPTPPCRKLLHLCVPYNGEDLVWHPVTKQMNTPAFQVCGWVNHAWLGQFTLVCRPADTLASFEQLQ